MVQKPGKKTWAVCMAVLLPLCIAAAFTKLFIGFDIDEGYAIAMPYRFLSGDRLFGDMWEIHQTSVFLPALLMQPFMKLTGGTEGIVLYLRVISALIHLIMSVIFYRMLRGISVEKLPALFGAVVYYNFLPKWMLSPDFSMQQLWGMTLLCFCLCLEDKHKGTPAISFATGIALSVTVLGYVGMVILYPVLVIIYAFDKEIKSRIKKMLWLTAGCAVMAAAFLAIVLSKTGFNEFVNSIPAVFSDGTHSLGTADKLILYASQWLNVGKQWLVFGGAGIIAAAIYLVVLRRMDKTGKIGKSGKEGKKEGGKTENSNDLLILPTEAVMLITGGLMVFGECVGIKMGPFHFQSRFLLLFTLFWIILLRETLRETKNKTTQETTAEITKDITHNSLVYKWMILVTGAFFSILLFSNVGPSSSSSYLGIGLILGCLVLIKKDGTRALACVFIFALSIIFCKGFYVRYTEYFPANILQERQKVPEGPLAGIYLLPEDAKTEEECRECVEKETQNGKTAMLLGTDQILDLSMNGSLVCPSTISTPAFNSQWTDYFEKYGHELPDVVFIAKNTVDDREKFFEKNEFGQYLAGYYNVEDMKENDSICVIRRK